MTTNEQVVDDTLSDESEMESGDIDESDLTQLDIGDDPNDNPDPE